MDDINPEGFEHAQRELMEAGVECAATICALTDHGSVDEFAGHARRLVCVAAVCTPPGLAREWIVPI